MTQQILEKRTYDNRLYNINCSQLLYGSATIATVNSISADQGGLSFGAASVNSQPVIFPDGTQCAAGTVIQVPISGGTIPTGLTVLVCTIRPQFTDTLGEQVEATVVMNLTNVASS